MESTICTVIKAKWYKKVKMSFKTRRLLTAVLVISLFIQMHVATDGYPSRGSKIAFTSARHGSWDIYVMDDDGRNQKRITVHPETDRYPAWSPDGTKIAFVSNRNKGYIQIWVIDADGGNPTRLTDGVWDNNPDWSPDGRKIAYDFLLNPWDNDKWNRTIYVMDSDGKNSRQLIEKPEWDTDPSWSPDGSRIAYETNDFIGVMDIDGTNQRRLTENGWHGHPTWSPDSESIAFHIRDMARGDFTVFKVGAKGGAVNPIGLDIGQSDFEPDWFNPGKLSVSPEGSRITMWGRLKDIAFSAR